MEWVILVTIVAYYGCSYYECAVRWLKPRRVRATPGIFWEDIPHGGFAVDPLLEGAFVIGYPRSRKKEKHEIDWRKEGF